METITSSSNKIKYMRLAVISCAFIFIAISLFLLIMVGIAKLQGPPPLHVPQSTLYYAEDGTVLAETNSGEKRFWLELPHISQPAVEATIAIEDKTFYKHHGFDMKRIGGAIIANIHAGKKAQGASTITQQYARTLFLSTEKTWKRKLREAYYTLRLEMNYEKDDILEGYLNTIYYGHGAYGIEAASQYYFGKSASDLSLAEAAMIAGIPKGPSYYSPLIAAEKAKQRQITVLKAMEKNGFITKEEAEEAAKEKIKYIGKHPYEKAEIAPYFNDAVKKQLRTKVGLDERTIQTGGLQVYTTLNKKHQKIVESIIDEEILENSNIQIGFLSMDPQTGYVTSLVGGKDYLESSFNRAIQAQRQPGSTMKPFLYYAALMKGFTPMTKMKSELTTFHFNNGKTSYTPRNYNNLYANDKISMEQALALSDNVYALKTHLFLGEELLVQTAKKFGITTKLENVPSLALGSSEVKLIDMVKAYSLLANKGNNVEPVFITKVKDYRGNVLYEHEKTNEQILNPNVVSVLTQMMTGMFDPSLNGYASVTGEGMSKQMTRPYAGKSGSTKTDNWMLGFTPQLTAGIWTGYDQGKKLTLTADTKYAKNIWIRFMEEALKNEPVMPFKPAKDVVALKINPDNGKIATEACPVSRTTYFIKGTEPTEYCTDHKKGGNEKRKRKKPWFQRLIPWL